MANSKVTPITTTAVAKAKVNLPVDVNEQMAAEVAAMQSRISAPSGDRIAATQQKTFKLPNGTEVDTLECVIVDFAAANMYYAAAYDRNNITPPDCFALGLEPAILTPSDNSPDKQAESCSSCPQNQFGSAGKGKACTNTRLLGLLPTDADINTPLMILKVSPTGIRAFDAHVNSVVRSYSMPLRGVITEISFDQSSDYATMRFRAIGPAPKELVMMAQSRKEESIARLLTEPDVSAATVASPKSRKLATAGRR